MDDFEATTPVTNDSNGFYDPTVNPATGNTLNRIADPDEAHVLADIARTQGMDAAYRREDDMRKEHETGLTEQERYNVGVVELLKEKYPYAFRTVTDKKGIEYNQIGLWRMDPDDFLAIQRGRADGLVKSGRMSQERIQHFQDHYAILRDEIDNLNSFGAKNFLQRCIMYTGGGSFFSKKGLSVTSDVNKDEDGSIIWDTYNTFIYSDSIKDYSQEELSLLKRVLTFINDNNQLAEQELKSSITSIENLKEFF